MLYKTLILRLGKVRKWGEGGRVESREGNKNKLCG
jgi:hypothetical protein